MEFSDYGNTFTEQEVQEAFKKADEFNNIDNSNIFRTTWKNGNASIFVEVNNIMGYLDGHGNRTKVNISPIKYINNFMLDNDNDDMPLNDISHLLWNHFGDEPRIYTCPYHPDVIWCLMPSMYRGYKVERIAKHMYSLYEGDTGYHPSSSYIWTE